MAELELRIKNSNGQLADALSIIGDAGVQIKDINIEPSDEDWLDVVIYTTIPNKIALEQLHSALKKDENITIVSITT